MESVSKVRQPVRKSALYLPPHDEGEPNLKKILHRNGVWRLEAIFMKFHLIFSKKSVSIAPERKITNGTFESESLNQQNFFNNKWKKFIKQNLFPIPTLNNKIFVLANFGRKYFWLKLEKSAKIFWSKIGRNKNFMKQSGYGEQLLFYKFFSFIIEKFCSFKIGRASCRERV